MREVVLDMHFPHGTLPTRGWRCPKCGHEKIHGADAADLQEKARDLGLFGSEHATTRKVIKTGTSLAVTLDPRALEAIGASFGDKLSIGVVGGKIVIRPADKARPSEAGSSREAAAGKQDK